MIITAKNGTEFQFRALSKTDVRLLGNYFESLSAESRSRFAPHPLTHEHAHYLCFLENDSAKRYVVLPEQEDEIAGYFILDSRQSAHEVERYQAVGIDLSSGLHLLFAPSVADKYQNAGIASAAMPLLLQTAADLGADSVVLLGGTQSTNPTAIALYQKFGFQYVTSYWTDIENYDMYKRLNK